MKRSRYKPIVERFFESVEIVTESGCWIWMGCLKDKRRGKQYGKIGTGQVAMRAHRYSWMHHYGPIPDDRIVCHRCDVTMCVNPHHLFLGDHLQNMLDMVRKGRAKHGPGFRRTANGG